MADKHDKAFILWFDDILIEDVALIGGKNASLCEMYQKLTSKGVAVPHGFAITSYAYRNLIKTAGIENDVKDAMAGLDTHDMKNLQERGKKVRNIIRNAEFPDDLRQAIIEAYRKMEEEYGPNVDVAVRSSATAEDLPDASFAGQPETFLNIRGTDALIENCRKCFASLFTNRAISYRYDKGFGQFDVYLSIAVQKMVRSDLASSGVIFSIDTESGFEDAVFITGSWGLGENVVLGVVNPDEYYVFKPTLKQGKQPIVGKRVGSKELKMIYNNDPNDGRTVKNIDTTPEERGRYILNDDEIIQLAKWACIIEDHYQKPMDIEWAKDGDGVNVGTGELYIVQARPIMFQPRSIVVYEIYQLLEHSPVLCSGQAIGRRIVTGSARIISSTVELYRVSSGDVIVTDMTDADWGPTVKIASAVITNRGGRTSHAAIMTRHLQIPAIIGCYDATTRISDGALVTVSCAEGDIGNVYEGQLKFEVIKTNLDSMPPIPVKMMMNVGIPQRAFSDSAIPNNGIGLARLEFIIRSMIGIHPKALLEFNKLPEELKAELAPLISAYSSPREFYVAKLTEGIATVCAAFVPSPVIVRMSDFKSNEYANLLGGTRYEPVEECPMIGWRGVSRYLSDTFRECFEMECEAIKRVRNIMGLTNLEIMIPFVRTIRDAVLVIEALAANGLKRGENGLRVIMMCELPSNALMADEFLEYFDGFSIGSNDMTQLTLGVDRDSHLIAHYSDQRDPAVKKLLRMAIRACRAQGKYVGICGEGPADNPDLVEWLAGEGITSISLNPDDILRTWLLLAKKYPHESSSE